jgi:nucleoside-diphosphate-sugar epimerase
VSVQDLVQAIILATNAENMNGRTFVITDGQAYSISEIEAAIYQALGKSTPRLRTPAVILYAASVVAGLLSKAGLRQGSISARTYRNLMNDNLFDNASICKELGFEPSIDLYDALPEIVENIVSTSEQQNKSQTRTK